MLGQLAADSVNLSEAQWEALKPYGGGWDSKIFHDGVAQAAKLVGFAGPEMACSNAAQCKHKVFQRRMSFGTTERQWAERIFQTVQF